MRVHEVLNEEGFLDKALGAIRGIMPPKMDDLVVWVRKNIRSKGTQWIYRNVDKEFPKRFVKRDVDTAINIVLKKR